MRLSASFSPKSAAKQEKGQRNARANSSPKNGGTDEAPHKFDWCNSFANSPRKSLASSAEGTDLDSLDNQIDTKMDLSFSGAGFMGCYYFGVAACWDKYIPRARVKRAAGASAGSLIAAYYLLDLPLRESLGIILELMEEMRRRPLGPFDRSNQMVDVLPRALDKMFPDDAHKRVSGRLFVSMTRLRDMKSVVVNEFESKRDLIDALNCSCFIPIWSGNHVATYKGVKHIDGGFTNNMPVFDEHTIRVCCFSGSTEIAPYDSGQKELLSGSLSGMPFYFTWKNLRRGGRALWPPPADYVIGLLERGFHDTKDFILSNDLIQCDNCYRRMNFREQPIYSKLTPTISPAATPQLSRAGSFRKTAGDDRAVQDKRYEIKGSHLNVADTVAKRGSFRSALSRKLNSIAGERQQQQVELLPFKVDQPTIVVEAPAEEAPSEAAQQLAAASGNSSPSRKRARPGDEPDLDGAQADEQPVAAGATAAAAKTDTKPQKLLVGRRATQPQIESNFLLADRFSFAPAELPSCPPSPSLNRHCAECIRLRQEARMDLIDEAIKAEVERIGAADSSRASSPAPSPSPPPPPPSQKAPSKFKLASPIKWIRQLGGAKYSYSFVADGGEQPALRVGAELPIAT